MLTARTLKLALVALAVAVPVALANSAGPSPGYTGAPGELTCRACHTSFPLNDGAGRVSVEGTPEVYEPGETYTLTVRVSHPNRARWGFQLVALTDSLDQAGSFEVVDAARTQLKTDDGKTYVEHKTAGTGAGTSGGASWNVRWTAPPPGAGTVTFYAAGNAANNNGVETGDNIYTTFAESRPAVETAPFEDATAAAGLAAAAGGSGVAWADFDVDGDPDAYVARGGDALLRNDGGRFTETAGPLGAGGAARSAAWGDFDGDGRPDLFAATAEGPRLFRNAAAGFEEAELGLSGPALFGAWADYDADGRLDLLVGLESGAVLLRNGEAGLADATEEAGLAGVVAPRAAAWADYDGDGRADLFVATAAGGRLFRNGGSGSFEEADVAAPAAQDAAWGDYDGDGRLDLFVAADAGLRLLRNDGSGGFDDETSAAGLGGVGGRALALEDADADGRVDLAVAGPSGVRLMRLDGAKYADATEALGLAAAGGGVPVWADYDDDGHADFFVLSTSGLEVWRNPSAAPSVAVRAVTDGDGDASDADASDDRDATGATVAFDTGSGAVQMRVLSGGGSAAQPPARVAFATPFATSARVRATFADGEGREAEVATGHDVGVTLADPRAARVDAVSTKLKKGTTRLLVDGAGFVTGREVVEVDGRALAKTKYPKARREADGTSTRLSGTDPSFDAIVPRGRAVRVTTFDPDAGVRSAPFLFVR